MEQNYVTVTLCIDTLAYYGWFGWLHSMLEMDSGQLFTT